MSTEVHCDICNEEIIRIPVFQLMKPRLYKIRDFGSKKELDICSKCWGKIFEQITEEKK